MRRIDLIAAFLLCFSFQAVVEIYAQNNFVIKCNIAGAKNRKVYLADSYGGYLNPNNPYTLDSIVPLHDTFCFYGSFEDNKYYSILIDTIKSFFAFIIDTGSFEIKGNVKELYKASILN